MDGYKGAFFNVKKIQICQKERDNKMAMGIIKAVTKYTDNNNGTVIVVR